MRKNPIWKILLISFAIVGAVFFNNLVLDNFVQNLFYKLAAGSGYFLTKGLTGTSRLGKGFLSGKAVVDENKKLQEENGFLLGRVAEIDGLKRENEFLRNELKVAPRLENRLLLTQIFSIQKNAGASTALINKGKTDGVGKSMAVITGGNILVGIVDQTFDDSALVLLLDDPRSLISIRIQGSNILAQTKGRLDGSFGVDLVTHEEEIKKDDLIVTSGLDGLAESLVVGKISEVSSDSAGLFKEITGRPLFDLSLGSGVFVILQ
jgi:rod shape-determining protein MreC